MANGDTSAAKRSYFPWIEGQPGPVTGNTWFSWVVALGLVALILWILFSGTR